MKEVAIVGGGPAGALCGERLAEAGFQVTIFDEHLAWEKPCGGGLTHKALETYPFLLDGPHPKRIVRSAELITSRGDRAELELNHPVVIYSRRVLNGLLLERAARAGCRLVRSRVKRIETEHRPVRLHTAEQDYAADFVVVAAGARNSLLPGTTPLGPEDLELTAGYFVPTPHAAQVPSSSSFSSICNRLKIKFLDHVAGYLWSFPRHDHLSVGMCAPMTRNTSRELKRHVHDFMREEGILPAAPSADTLAPAFYSHVLPSVRPKTLRERRVLGANWALVGDAAGWVDPLTGEGLYYAMRSGDLLGQALVRGQPEDYLTSVRKEFCPEFEMAVRAAHRFFDGMFLGRPVIMRMIQFLQRSPTLRKITAELFSGEQDYRTLKARLVKGAGVVLAELLASMFCMRKNEQQKV